MASRADRHGVPIPDSWTPPDGVVVHGDGPSLPCALHEQRLDEHSERYRKLETKVADHDKRLATGDVTLAEFRKDIHALTQSVTNLTSMAQKGIWIVVSAVIVAVLSQVLKH